MQKRPFAIAAVSGPLLGLAFFALLAYGSQNAEKEKETDKVFRDNDYNGWVIPFIQASPSSFSLGDDLFHIQISRSGANLKGASIELMPKKIEYFANPNKDSMVSAWPITKFTRYQDLNGDGEFDWMLKSLPSKEKPNGPNDKREFIIVDDSIVEIKGERTKPGFRKEFVSLKGERFVMTPDGWVKK